MEFNKFDKALRELALSHAPEPLAKCGDIVTVQWGGWKKPHRVRIYEVGVEIVSLAITIGQRKALGIEGWMGVQHYYYAFRVKDDGERVGSSAGFVLPNFTTDDGKRWESLFPTFNHAGLSFKLSFLDGEGGRGNSSPTR